jgi:hypothetical protein
MIDLIGTMLKDAILASGVAWLDKVGGIVKAVTFTTRDSEGNDVEKTIPATCNYNTADCNTPDYEDFTPNTDRKSILYFEDQGISYEDVNGRFTEGSADVRLVLWLNLPALGDDSTCNISSEVVPELFAAIPDRLPNSSPLFNIRVRVTGESIKDAGIFSNYTYDEKDTQYLMHPYDFLALNLNVRFWLTKACHNDYSTNPAICP